jgi:hypothetical protein
MESKNTIPEHLIDEGFIISCFRSFDRNNKVLVNYNPKILNVLQAFLVSHHRSLRIRITINDKKEMILEKL